jgi:hypothetical protein
MDPGLLMDLSEESVLVLARAALVLVVEEEIVEPEATRVLWTVGFDAVAADLAPESTLVATLALGSTLRLCWSATASSSTSSPFFAEVAADTVRVGARAVRAGALVAGSVEVAPAPLTVIWLGAAAAAALSLSDIMRVAVGTVEEALVGDSSMADSILLRVRAGGGIAAGTSALVDLEAAGLDEAEVLAIWALDLVVLVKVGAIADPVADESEVVVRERDMARSFLFWFEGAILLEWHHKLVVP